MQSGSANIDLLFTEKKFNWTVIDYTDYLRYTLHNISKFHLWSKAEILLFHWDCNQYLNISLKVFMLEWF